MKLALSRKYKQLGAALLVAMCISAFLCICITGYLSLAEHQSYMSARSQAWNIAISVTEAGVEEGLAQLNCSYTNLSNNGWTLDSGTGSYYRSNSMPDGNSYTVNIWTTNAANPVIIARAYTVPPSLAKNQSSVFFAAVNTTITQPAVTRAVKVTCSRGNLFLSALVAKHTIDLNGNGILTDSYSSQDPSKNTNGKYDSSKYTGDMGDVASNGGIPDALSIGNGNVYGKVHISPNAPLSMVTVGSNGGIGTHAWQASNSGSQPGYVIQDANFTFPDTTMPDTSSGYLGLPPGGTNVTVSSTYTTNGVSNSPNYPTNGSPWAGVSTNTSFSTNVAYSPTPVSTNFSTVNTLTYPGAKPGMVTNSIATNTVSYPSPAPAGGVTTNYTSIPQSNQSSAPPAGSYVPGSLSQRANGHYDYLQITGIASYSYSLPLYAYQVIAGYVYASLTYNYSNYATNFTYTTNVYDHIFAANTKYNLSSMTGSNLLAGPNITIVLPNGLTGSEKMTWASGAYLAIYAGGSSVAVSGNNYINPNNGYAGSLIVYCAPTVTSFALNGNGQFTGILVAPNADIRLNGGGSSYEDFCGSIMCNSAVFNGHFRFHYDEALQGPNTNGRWLATSWNEVN